MYRYNSTEPYISRWSTEDLLFDPHQHYQEFISTGGKQTIKLMDLTSVHLQAIKDNLHKNPELKSIHLINSSLEDEDLEQLLQAISTVKLRHLCTLDLHGNRLTFVSLQVLARYLPDMICLTNVDFSQNKIKQVPEFQPVCRSTDLCINLSRNTDLQYTERLFTQLQPTYCALSNVELKNEDVLKITQLAHTFSLLFSLDLSFNQITDEGINYICTYLLTNGRTNLKEVFLKGNPFTEAGNERLIHVLQENTSIVAFTPHTLLRTAVLLRTDYEGKKEITKWLQQNSLEAECRVIYRYRLTIHSIQNFNIGEIAKQIEPSNWILLYNAIERLKVDSAKCLSRGTSASGFQDCLSLNDIHKLPDAHLGEGNFATVHLGLWQNSIPVVLKLFKSQNTFEYNLEADIVCKLKHPNIVTCYGKTVVDNKYCLVFERGELDIARWKTSSTIFKGKLPEEQYTILLQFSIDICRALLFLKSKRLVHRDISLRNAIVFCENGEPVCAKLADFGLARFTKPVAKSNADDADTYCDVRPGSVIPRFESSPESSFRYSSKSEVWSLGIFLWHLFSTETISNELLDEVKSGSTVVDSPFGCPPEVFSVVQQCLVARETRRLSIEKAMEKLTELSNVNTCIKFMEIGTT